MANNTTPHLIASVGTWEYEQVQYRLGDAEYTTRFAPVALAKLISPEGGKASILVTAEARAKWYERLASELREVGFTPEPLEVPHGRNEAEIMKIFRILANRIGRREEVVLDVTFALRHLPFVYLAALVYLTGLREVRVRGIFYGAADLREENRVPILEVTHLFQLVEWYRALAAGAENGDFVTLARMLRRDCGRLFRQGLGDRELARTSTIAHKLAFALASGLPLEAGFHANGLCRVVGSIDRSLSPAYASGLALDNLVEVVRSWAILSGHKASQKAALELDRAELERQLNMTAWYLDRMNLPTALSLLREWLVNLVLWAQGRTDQWLDYNLRRKPVESFLNALSERAQARLATEAEKGLAGLWSAVTKRRNSFAHAGMTPEEVKEEQTKVRTLMERCRKLLADPAIPTAVYHTEQRYLISPLGFSPGALYSAVCHVQPDRLVVITSAEAREHIPTVLSQARRAELEPEILELSDPHQGFAEVNSILARRHDLRRVLACASEVVTNLTGGTTAMQFAAEQIGRQVQSFGTPLRRVAVVDRRSYDEQRQEPYVLGELIELDPD